MDSDKKSYTFDCKYEGYFYFEFSSERSSELNTALCVLRSISGNFSDGYKTKK